MIALHHRKFKRALKASIYSACVPDVVYLYMFGKVWTGNLKLALKKLGRYMFVMYPVSARRKLLDYIYYTKCHLLRVQYAKISFFQTEILLIVKAVPSYDSILFNSLFKHACRSTVPILLILFFSQKAGLCKSWYYSYQNVK